MDKIIIAESETDIKRCFPVMAELRTHLKDENDFFQRVKRQRKTADYKLIFLEVNGQIKSAAGIRISECLAWGKFLYVDDLVTFSSERSKGYGEKLFDRLVSYAVENSCDQFHLDSGVQRFGAHRFYLKKRMDITSHHFALKLK
jgi:GNAT superfamily N-acetyltransferase